MQWTSYRIGRCYLVENGQQIGWCLVGPVWPFTGFPHFPALKSVLRNGNVNVASRIDQGKYVPMLDWKIRTR